MMTRAEVLELRAQIEALEGVKPSSPREHEEREAKIRKLLDKLHTEGAF